MQNVPGLFLILSVAFPWKMAFNFMKKLGKLFFNIIIGFALLFAGYLLGFWTNFYYLSYKYNPVRLSNERALKDIHGGKTPEETYGLFVSALKQENTELASKYFVLGKQDEKFTEFKKIKESGELQKYIEDLPKWSEMREMESFNNELKEFQYKSFREKDIKIIDKLTKKEEILKTGWYITFISFHFNPTTHIWKIKRL